jgi:hypothetical protein
MELQAEAERRKRASILESEGQRQAVINVAEGSKQEVRQPPTTPSTITRDLLAVVADRDCQQSPESCWRLAELVLSLRAAVHHVHGAADTDSVPRLFCEAAIANYSSGYSGWCFVMFVMCCRLSCRLRQRSRQLSTGLMERHRPLQHGHRWVQYQAPCC